MIRIPDILQAFRGYVGWQQSEEEASLIAESLTASESGLYYQHAHPLLTLTNLKSVAPAFSNLVRQTYSSTKQYTVGEIVIHNNVLYRAKSSTINVTPGTNTLIWEVYNAFSNWLSEKTDAIIINMINAFINTKTLNSNTNELLLNDYVFSAQYYSKKPIQRTSSLVGFEFKLAPSRGIVTKINKIGLFFSDTFTLKLYVYNTSSEEPVSEVSVNVEKDKITWVSIQDLLLPGTNSLTRIGSWFIMYDENELPEGVVAYSSSYNFGTDPCSYCSQSEALRANNRKRYLSVAPIKTDSSPADTESNLYTLTTNYGLNFEVSVYCDLTDFIIQQKHIFGNLLLKQGAIMLLRELAFNPNAKLNRNSTNSLIASKQEILYELDGDSTSLKKSGLVYEYKNALMAVDLNTRGQDSSCLPCKSKGIRYKTIG